MTSDRHNHSDTKQANCQIKYRLVHINSFTSFQRTSPIGTAVMSKDASAQPRCWYNGYNHCYSNGHHYGWWRHHAYWHRDYDRWYR